MLLTWGFWSCRVSSARHTLCQLVLIMAPRSFALGGEGRTGCRPRGARSAANLVAGTDLRACVRLILRCAGADPRVLTRLCLRDELPAVPGRSYWRVVLDFVAFPNIG